MNENQPDPILSLDAESLARLQRELHQTASRKQPKGRRGHKERERIQTAAAELQRIKQVLAEHVESQQTETREQLHATLVERAISHDAIHDISAFNDVVAEIATLLGIPDHDVANDLYKEMQRRGPATSLTFEQTRDLHVGAFTHIRSAVASGPMLQSGIRDEYCNFTHAPPSGYPWAPYTDYQIDPSSLPAEMRQSLDSNIPMFNQKPNTIVGLHAGGLIAGDESTVGLLAHQHMGMAFARQVPSTKPWAGIALAQNTSYLTSFDLMGKAVASQALLQGVNSPNEGTVINAESKARALLSGMAVAQIQSSSGGESYFDAVEVILQHSAGEMTVDSLCRLAQESEVDFMRVIERMDDTITTGHYDADGSTWPEVQFPLSREEQMSRLVQHIFTLAFRYAEKTPATLELKDCVPNEEQIEGLQNVATSIMDTIPERIYLSDDAELHELMTILCPEILEDEEMVRYLYFVRSGGRISIIIPVSLNEQFAQYRPAIEGSLQYIPDNTEFTYPDMRNHLESMKAFMPEDNVPSDGTPSQGTTLFICTLAELENHFFSVSNVSGRFLSQEPREDGGDNGDDVEDGGIEKDDEPPIEEPEWHPVRRMRALRRALLQEGVHATFSYDETEPSNMQSYSELAQGHYAVVTITDPDLDRDLNLQIIISDDPQLGCYQVFNNNQPIDYTNVHLPDISQMGATPINWDRPEQFVRSVRTSIQQQRTNPMRVYPVHPSVDCPLDALHFERNREDEDALQPALDGLRIDIERVAARVNKETEPWTVIPNDFRIFSGEMLWSFGGNASGPTYIDRVARRIGLNHLELRSDEEHDIRQDQFRWYTLHTILRALYPDDAQSLEEIARATIQRREQQSTTRADQTTTRDPSS